MAEDMGWRQVQIDYQINADGSERYDWDHVRRIVLPDPLRPSPDGTTLPGDGPYLVDGDLHKWELRPPEVFRDGVRVGSAALWIKLWDGGRSVYCQAPDNRHFYRWVGPGEAWADAGEADPTLAVTPTDARPAG